VVYSDDSDNILGRGVHSIQKNRDALVVASKEIGLEVRTQDEVTI